MPKLKMTRLKLTLTIATVATAALAWSLPAVATAAATTTVKVTAGQPSEFHFQLSTSSVTPGKVVFDVTNKGTISHDFKIDGKQTPLIAPGKSAKLTVAFTKAGKYPYLCTVPGHAAAGMKGTLTVK